jgi:protein LTV1
LLKGSIEVLDILLLTNVLGWLLMCAGFDGCCARRGLFPGLLSFSEEEVGVDLRGWGGAIGASGIGYGNAVGGGGGGGGGSDGEFDDDDAMTMKSRFTEYSMSSSILPRSEALQVHDERFEKLYEQYDDEKLGALEEQADEIIGSSDLMANFEGVLDEFLEGEENTGKKIYLTKIVLTPVLKGEQTAGGGDGEEGDEADEAPDAHLFHETGSKAQKEMMLMPYRNQPKGKDFDCESILSTRSTLYNHPTRIVEPSAKIKIDPKTGLPIRKPQPQGDGAGGDEGGNSDIDDDDDDKEPAENMGVPRDKKESKAEKKARKQAIKDERRTRRETKKATTTAFKAEEKRQKVEVGSNPRHGLRIKQLD